MRTPLIAGNWKMYKTRQEAFAFVDALKNLLASIDQKRVEGMIFAPYLALVGLADALAGTGIHVGAQNVHQAKEGAHTGEVSLGMLREVGVESVILGHSERRADCGETDQAVAEKTEAVLLAGLTPIVCVGETLEQREAGQTVAVISAQVNAVVEHLTRANAPEELASKLARLVFAYEPIWAIGTGKTASVSDATGVISGIRSTLTRVLDNRAEAVRILYGGSVKPENLGGFLAEKDIDGALVGGASLAPDSYAALLSVAAEANAS
ncbi:triose-phosphate isomerase [Ferroacidibacillus organovorans]|uniref:Triosephosphate isomerase n=1 Tax=Ferroacidibacillus organovorans TaxID=1765683 RepID=A0A101XTV2_9BACL|nr:triose-phosphate isomerase [Ferroacidibacillus organovorans]KUO97448.1 triose-phosphate isomerase [Ferroacidibacillus organovorans]KUO97470.1 triose-phosphate isomerase [Ferroacidibacillus organovorans]